MTMTGPKITLIGGGSFAWTANLVRDMLYLTFSI
jgi:alpha-galactosidase/6-phospho-beta-glucosidase family protein